MNSDGGTQMVNRSARLRVVDALARYLRGEVNNFDLDEALGHDGGDQTVRQIAWEMWYLYDDCKEHRVALGRRELQLVRRCIAFLRTEAELPDGGSQRGLIDFASWPFPSRRSLIAARPDLSDLNIPAFDPAVHDVPIRTPAESSVIWLRVVVGLLVILAFAISWLGLLTTLIGAVLLIAIIWSFKVLVTREVAER